LISIRRGELDLQTLIDFVESDSADWYIKKNQTYSGFCRYKTC
jgi:hypothetical protein